MNPLLRVVASAITALISINEFIKALRDLE